MKVRQACLYCYQIIQNCMKSHVLFHINSPLTDEYEEEGDEDIVNDDAEHNTKEDSAKSVKNNASQVAKDINCLYLYFDMWNWTDSRKSISLWYRPWFSGV